jgi:PilZ domain
MEVQLKFEKRSSDRIDAYWERSIRLYLKNGQKKNKVRLVNCSTTGMCIEISEVHNELLLEDQANLLLQVGDETCAFSVTIMWIAPHKVEETGIEVKRYGARIESGTETNRDLYQEYVKFLFLKNRFQ